MPVIDNPDPDHPMKKIACFVREGGRRARLHRPDRFAAEHVLVRECGAKSADDLPSMSVHTVIGWWLEEEPKRGTKKESLVEAKRLLTTLLAPLRERDFGTLSIEDFNEILDGLDSRGKSDPTKYGLTTRTIYGQGKLLEQFVAAAKQGGFIHFNPAAIANMSLPKLQPNAGKPFHPDQDEQDRLRLAAIPIVLAIVDCAIEAGGNAGEIRHLLREDCDFRAMTVKWRGSTSRIDPTGDSLSRKVPMTPRLAASLIRYRLFAPSPDRCTNMFVTQKGKPVHYTALGQFLRMTQLKLNMVHREGQVSGRSGRPASRGRADKTRALPIAKYDIVSLGHVAAIRWASTTGLRGVADKMGLTVKRADELYKHLYEKQRALASVLENIRRKA